ncbi:Glucooligosaccharide oxidase [Serendipita vermifera MAFF 305830]|uniref:Glucooligosaccharide oxidase n=1 Tax=Serendipita vermifera MAFF 305830 TaxID=933852 RepID=A0A0C2XGM7_SERVB|nr:Glucooligosaccharide oxidase [Serendipita vermifera MAFF 305830]
MPENGLSHPSAVAYPTTPEEVAILVRAAGACGLAVVSRSGGHNYAGFSSGAFGGEIADKRHTNGENDRFEKEQSAMQGEGNGVLVIDLSSFNNIKFDEATGDGTEIVTIGAGCRLGRVATVLAEKGRALPHGVCPTVSIGGHAAHGGHGLSSRKWGLTMDRIVSHEVVLSDGTISNVPVSSSSKEGQADLGPLSWALRGAGPSFGVITSYTLRTFPMPPVAVHFDYWFSPVGASLAADAMIAYQDWIPWVPGEIGLAFMFMTGEGDGTIQYKLTGQYLGPRVALDAIVSPFLKTLQRLGISVTTESKTQEFPPDLRGFNVGQNDQTEGPIWSSDSFYAKSLAIFDKKEDLLTREQALALTSYLKADPSLRKTVWFVMLDNWGGVDSAISSVPSQNTASNTRENLYAFQMFVRPEDRRPPFTSDGVQFLKGMCDAIINARRDLSTWRYGGVANYVDPELSREEAQQMYYGKEKLVKLREVKRRFDPGNVFRYPHSILPA